MKRSGSVGGAYLPGFAWLSGLVLGVFAFNAVAYSCTAGGEAVLDYRGIYVFDAKTFVPKRGAKKVSLNIAE